MVYRKNETAVGVYRTLEGTGLGHPLQVRTEPHGEPGDEDYRAGTPGQWDEFERGPDGWAAYDRGGVTWRISENEAAEILGQLS